MSEIEFLVTSDLHFTDHPNDAYRFEIFDYLCDLKKSNEIKTNKLFVLGDITDKKDKHSSELVYKIVSGFIDLATFYNDVIILMGNHDYIDSKTPFFDFINYFDNITFVKEPWRFKRNGVEFLMIPHGYNPKDYDLADVNLLHHSVYGAEYSNFSIDCESDLKPSYFENSIVTISGDIHKPQDFINNFRHNFIYAGSPYQIRYDDYFEPRMLHVKVDLKNRRFKTENFKFDTINKFTVTIKDEKAINNIQANKRDQVKVKCEMDFSKVSLGIVRSKLEHKMKDLGVNVFKFEFSDISSAAQVDTSKTVKNYHSDKEVFDRSCAENGIEPNTQRYEIGEQIINEYQDN